MSETRDNHRQYYRLAYPSTMMPSVYIDEREYFVPEISEGGLRIRSDGQSDLRVGEQISAQIVFVDGDTISVKGIVLRRDRHDLIIAPLEGISFKRVVTEQRRVLRECPSVRSE